ncbi:hypothetical protein HHI36_016504 [Cryptolaemus montrouzieri]|uniref:Uncharacterized protein n=1 Tax=Cryptolaemus montrouzieri TaxID=559131 RepID=A0ABD2NKQ5_9CUCU
MNPKITQNSKDTREDIRNHIKAIDLSIGFSNIKSFNNGGDEIVCKHDKDRFTMNKETSAKLGNKYNIKLTEVRNPRIRITGIKDSFTEEELKKMIINQNEHIPKESEMKIITIKKELPTYYATMQNLSRQ